MKKVILVGSILFVAVLSTACINNLAVQDLNNKAKMYADKGDYVQAIERLKSGIDLDPSFYETHYNLAVVYTKAEDYLNATEEFKKVIEMKPDNADSYYSLATAQNNLAVDMTQGRVRMGVDDVLYTPKADEFNFTEKYELSDKEKNYVNDLYSSSLANYQKYLDMSPNAKDREEVEKQIEAIERALNPEETPTVTQ